jgi:hypothetical protein
LARQDSATPDAPVAPQLSAEQFAQLLQAVTAQKSTLDVESLATILKETSEGTAKAMQKALKPENQDHPGKSVFSHPLGDLAMPKPPLPYELSWKGYPVNKFPETETWSEWLAQSNIPGKGEYTVLRLDGSKMKVTVETETDADGKVTKMVVDHPATRADKDKIPPKTVIIAQMQGKDNPKAAFLASMQAQLAEMFGES